jgi:RNA polymerase sigma factor (sigma-70 family)
MAASPSDQVLRQVHRLFNFGAVGTMSDPRLLDQIASRRDEAAEAAFEELVIRHGPMVFRVCQSVLHDAHDAEDAFQAVFIVLANRAGSIRRSASVASWLFGVAQRVATRAKRGDSRRRALNQRVADRTSESYLPAANDPDWEILHDETMPARPSRGRLSHPRGPGPIATAILCRPAPRCVWAPSASANSRTSTMSSIRRTVSSS